MRFRHLQVVLGILLVCFVPRPANADGHRAGLGGGFTYAEGSKLWGFTLSGDWSPDIPGSKYYSIMGDFSAVFNDYTRTTFGAGVSVSPAKDPKRSAGASRFIFSAHTFVAAVHTTESTTSAFVFGPTLEWVPRGSSDREFAIRFQYDRFVVGDEREDFNRFVVGGVYRWMKH